MDRDDRIGRYFNKNYKYNITFNDIRKKSDDFSLVDTAEKRLYIKLDLELFNNWLNALNYLYHYSGIDNLNNVVLTAIVEDISKYEYKRKSTIKDYLENLDKFGFFKGLEANLIRRSGLLIHFINDRIYSDMEISDGDIQQNKPLIYKLLEDSRNIILEKIHTMKDRRNIEDIENFFDYMYLAEKDEEFPLPDVDAFENVAKFFDGKLRQRRKSKKRRSVRRKKRS